MSCAVELIVYGTDLLTEAAMCINLINESLFNIIHRDFLLCKHNCIAYAWLQIFERGSLG